MCEIPKYIIREIEKSELPILKDFLYEAIFQKDLANPLPRDIIKQPEISIYIDDFGKEDDYCLIAKTDNMIIGAVWSRILAGELKGFGNINDETPEFAVSILPEFRGKGIGTEIIKAMLVLLKNKNYKQVSLSVQEDNYAVKIYENLGFKTIKKQGEELIMLKSL